MEQFKRIISVVAVLPPLILFLYYAPMAFFLVLVLGLVVLSLHEYFHMLALVPLPVCPKTSYVMAILYILTAYLGGIRWLPMMLFLSIVALTVSAFRVSQPGAERFRALLYSLFGVLFIGWSLSHLILLRHLETGKGYIFFLCGIVWLNDSAAMYVGKGLGRHQMAPVISPGKTWEGAIGGILGGLLAATLGARVFLPHLALWQSVLLGFLLALAAQISDLGESMLKRYTGVKDSGALIPGHGGLLDRIDGLLFAAPMLVYVHDLLMHTYVS
ncbi:hypothetical protein NKDENANG_00186 [Candidatus Entotheonellaceae bacterium PAL068K]